MRLILDSDFIRGSTLEEKKSLFSDKALFDKRFSSMLLKMTEQDAEDAIRVLNLISNQGITNIDFSSLQYTVDGNITLGFLNFATSELMFLLSFVADRAKMGIFIRNYMQQLNDSVCRTFFSIFKNSDYINIVLEEEHLAYYSDMLNEVRSHG